MKDKLCFSTLGCADESLESACRLATRYGIEGLEIRGADGIMSNSEINALSQSATNDTLTLFSTYGIKPVVLGTSVKLHDPSKRDAMLTEGKADIDIASRLHIPYIRVFGNNVGPDPEASIGSVSDGLVSLISYAAERDVAVLLEVHGGFNRSETLLPVIESVNARSDVSATSFGLIWDVAHSDTVYGDSWLPFYHDVRTYIRHIHIKDHMRATPERPKLLTKCGDGNIPLHDIISHLNADGYQGFFSLELERKWVSSLPPLEEALPSFISLFNNK